MKTPQASKGARLTFVFTPAELAVLDKLAAKTFLNRTGVVKLAIAEMAGQRGKPNAEK